jgi:tryptophan synthase alpha chain
VGERIQDSFARLAREGRRGLIPYVTAGDPDPAASGHILRELVRGGADLLELGIPFSDPMADGPVIQAAMGRALRAGTTLARVLELCAEFRREDTRTPIVLFGYLNPLWRYGLERFARDAVTAGADGLLVVDLPPEEAEEVTTHTRPAGLDFIALFAPTSSLQRMRTIARQASGFAYYVSMAGVTGGQVQDLEPVAQGVAQVRQACGLPVAVGFGVKTGADAQRIAAFADAVVVGSALVDAMAHALPVEAPVVAGEIIRDLRHAIDYSGKT